MEANLPCDKKPSVTDALDILEKLLKDNNLSFHNRIIAVLGSKKIPWELTQFCMRDLQWHEVKKAILELLDNTTDPRFISVMNDILAVYENNWEDSDLYEYYSKK